MRSKLRTACIGMTLLSAIAREIVFPVTARAVSKNVWIDTPVNITESAKREYRCGSSTECFTAKTSWPEGAAWTWYGATLQGSATNYPSSACKDFTAPEGPVNVTAVYNGEVSYAAIVTAVKLDWTTVATTPTDRKRTTVGVGEEVNLSVLPSTASPVAWSLWPTTGAGTLSASSGSTITFTAGDTGADPTIYVVIGDAESIGAECIVSFSVIPPSGVAFIELADRHLQWSCSAGFHAQVTILPTNVSFYRTAISELECYATTTGCYDVWKNQQHPRWSVGWLTPAQDNSLPTWVDYVWSGIIYPAYRSGTFLWPIPWNYRLPSDSSDGHNFGTLNHCATATDSGVCTMDKNDVSVTFSPADPTCND
jgi:hypothetical protein